MGYASAPGAMIRMGVDGADTSARQIDTVAASMNRLSDTAMSVARKLAATVGIGGGLAEVIQMSDEYAKFTSQLRLATGSQREYSIALADVKRIAKDAQAELSGTGVLYARISNGTRELGISQARVAAITEVVNLSLKVSAATTAEAASAQLQLSQAFASGTLRGEEFNAVNEAAPRLMKALADGMGMPIGALKKMASDGKITSQVMADVLPGALEKLREEATHVQTIGGAFQVLKNSVMEFTAVKAEANGTVSVLTGGLALLANNLTLVVGLLTTLTAIKAGTWFAGWVTGAYQTSVANAQLRATTLLAAQADVAATGAASALAAARVVELRAAVLAAEGNVALAVTTNGLIPAQARAALAAEAHAAALATQSTAMAAASVAGGALRSAVAFLGGPVGVVIALLGIAATAWSVFGSKSKEGTALAAESFDEAHKRIVKGLDEQIAKNETLLRLRNAGLTVSEAEKRIPNLNLLAAASNRLTAINQRSGEFAPGKGMSNTDVFFERLKVLKQIDELNQKIAKEEQGSAAVASGTRATQLAAWYAENGTKAQQLTAELAKLKKQFGEIPPEMEKLVRARFADKGSEAAIKHEESAYASLITAIRSKAEENRQEVAIGEDLAESAKMQIKLDQMLASGKVKISAQHEELARSALVELSATERLVKEQSVQRNVTKYIVESTNAREESLQALGAEYAAYGKSADARDMMMVSVKAQADTQKKLSELELAHMPISSQIRAQLQAEEQARVAVGEAVLGQTKALQYAAQLKIENKQFAVDSISDPRARAAAQLQIDTALWQERIRLAGAGTEAQKTLQKEYDTWYANRLKGVDSAVDVTQATQLLDIMTALDEAAKSAATSMANSFGQVGASIGGLTTSLTEYGRTQAAISAQLAAAKKDAGGDQGKIQRANAVAAQQSAQAQIKSYGDMTSAAKGFFKEGSRGYGALEVAEKTFRAVEMAMAVKNMVVKSGMVEAFTGLFVAGKATETAATVASVAPDVAASVAKGTAAAAVAVAKQASGGDAYSAWPRMALMAAAMAALGFAVSGGGGSGGGESAADVQKKQGTGSVLGDTDAKSASIARSIELASANSSIELTHTAGMLASLRAIESSMSGLTNLIARTTGVTDGSNMGIATGQLNKGAPTDMISSVMTGVTKALLGPGLGGAISSLINNLWGKTTQNIVDSGFQLGGSVRGLQSGQGYAQYASVDTTKSSWFGLSKSTSNSVQTQGLSSELSSQFGLIFTNLEGSLKKAAAGVGIDAAQVASALDNLRINDTKISLKGLTGDALTEAVNAVLSKTMDQMAEAALPAFDAFRKVGEGYAETVVRVSTNYSNLDSILQSAGMTFGAVGMASLAMREKLIDAAGGIDTLASQTNSFAENYLTEAQRLAPVAKYVTEQMAALGQASVDTRDKFRDLVQGIDKTTPAGQELFVSLMALEGAFAKTHAAAEDLTMSEQAIADQRKDLQSKYDELTMTSEQLRAKERATIDASNLALFDMITNRQAANAATEALNTMFDSLKTNRAGILAYRDSLQMGSLSTLTPMQKYLEAQRQYTEDLVKAKANPADAAAQSAVQAASTSFLTASQVINASSAAFVADRAKVLGDMSSLADIVGTQMSDAQQQLSLAGQQVSSLATLNATAVGIQQAILDVGTAGGAGGSVFDAQRYSAPANVGSDVLVAEIKQLRAAFADLVAETKGRRTDAQRQADMQLDATDESAETVAKLVAGAVESGDWNARNLSRRPTR